MAVFVFPLILYALTLAPTVTFEDSGEFRSFVNVYLNDDDIRQLSGRDTPVADGDLIQIVPSIAGGWT